MKTELLYTNAAKISRWLVGVLLLLSGFTKAGDTDAFVNLVVQYGFPSLAWLAPVITIVEAATGACLLLNIRPRQVSLAAMAMIIVFSAAFLYAHLFKGVADCGCFGQLDVVKLSPAATFVRNAVLLVLLVLSWRYSSAVAAPVVWHRYLAVLAILLCVSFFSGYSYKPGKKTPQRHPLYERAVKETVLPQLVTTSPDSTYMVFIFSYRCDGCWNYFDNIKRYYDFPQVADRLVVLAAGQDSTGAFNNYFRPEFKIQAADEQLLSQLVQAAPSMLYVSGDTIRHVVQGVIMTRYLFEKNYLQTP